MNGRKSLKDISWLVSEEEYRADPAYSYSTIAKYDREGFEKLSTLFDKVESPSLLFGSMVDTLLTDGQAAFDEKFFVATFPDIPDNIKKIVDHLFNSYIEQFDSLENIPVKDIITATEIFEYQKNWKPETRAKVIIEKGATYYSLLYLAGDKTVVSSELYADVVTCVDLLKTSKATKWYFEEDNPFDDSIERLYQLKFKGEYDGIPLRCMMDLAIVDHKNKVIIPCDLKTSYKPEYNFFKSFIEWRYYIQAQLYWEILRQNIEKDDYFKDFTILDYRFIVICNKTRNPLVWEYPDTQITNDLKYGKNQEIVCRNWRGTVKELNYYLTYSPNAPKEITYDKPNDLTMWLNG